MAQNKLYTVVAVVGISAAGAAAYWYQTRPAATGGGPDPASVASSGARPGAPAGGGAGRPAGVEVAKVEVTRMQDEAQAVGSLASRQSVMLRPEVAGRVQVIGFADGSSVRKGQTLVQLDDTLQRAELKQAEAQYSIAQANFRRNQELVAQNFVAQRVLDESAASLQVAEAQRALAQARLARMRIVAPFDGVAGIARVSVGDYVKDGADLVNLEDLGTMLLDFRLPERFQTRIRTGQTVQVQLDALPGRVFDARVTAVDPLLDADGRAVAVRASLPNNDGRPAPVAARPGGGGAQAATGAASAAAPGAAGVRPPEPAAGASRTGPRAGSGAGARPGGAAAAPLRPGMFARINVVFSVNEQALVVPEEAIVPQGGRQFVVKVVDPASLPPPAAGASAPVIPPDVNTVSKRQEVRLGIRRAGKVEVLEGVKAGETVVVAGQQRLQRDGTPVRIVELGRGPGAAGAAAGGASAAAPASAASR